MMALPPQASNQKLAPLPLKSADVGVAKQVLAIYLLGRLRQLQHRQARSRPVGNAEHERKKLGVNSYTAPEIARMFQWSTGLSHSHLINLSTISLSRFPPAASKED
jgi:hypothetical protein